MVQFESIGRGGRRTFEFDSSSSPFDIFFSWSVLAEIYSKIAQNDSFQARPAVVHFGGIELGKTQKQILKLVNVSTEVQRLHIVPPQSKYFSVKYAKQVY